MKQRRRFSPALALLAVQRRKASSALLVAAMLIASGLCVVLGSLRDQQETALAQAITESKIQCIATSATGRADGIGVLSPYLDMVIGKRHVRGCYLDEYVKDVNCLTKRPLEVPKESELRHIYSLDSDLFLRAEGGGTITFYDGWDETVFAGTEKVCVVSDALAEKIEVKNGAEVLHIVTRDGLDTELTVVGHVSGLSDKIAYCPYFAQMKPGYAFAYTMDSFSFLIKDNSRLEETKEQLYDYFIQPELSRQEDSTVCGLLVQDEVYLATLKELKSNLALLRFLQPILLVMTALIAFLTGYLVNRRRLREFAVMRCIGQKRSGVFLQTLLEQGILVFVGNLLGLAAGSSG